MSSWSLLPMWKPSDDLPMWKPSDDFWCLIALCLLGWRAGDGGRCSPAATKVLNEAWSIFYLCIYLPVELKNLLSMDFRVAPDTNLVGYPAKYALKNKFLPESWVFNYQIQYTAVYAGISIFYNILTIIVSKLFYLYL